MNIGHYIFSISANSIELFWRKSHFSVLQCILMGLFSPSHAFSGGFWQISLKRSLYVKNLKKSFLRPLFRATFPLNTDLNSSSGSLWDPFGPSGTPLWTPLGGPRGSQRTNLSWSSTGKLLGIMVRATSLLNSDFNSSSGTLWDRLGGP